VEDKAGAHGYGMYATEAADRALQQSVSEVAAALTSIAAGETANGTVNKKCLPARHSGAQLSANTTQQVAVSPTMMAPQPMQPQMMQPPTMSMTDSFAAHTSQWLTKQPQAQRQQQNPHQTI